MNFNDLAEKLANKGWESHATSPFQEKVAQQANVYFTYTSVKQQGLGICIFEQEKTLRLRVGDSSRNDFRWFESKYKDSLAQLIETILIEQDEVSLSNYFGLYGELSGVCETAFLAWEQWESNYR